MTLQRQHLIALCGFAGTGKDTVADILRAHFGFRKIAFADALRGEVAKAFDVSLHFFMDPVLKNQPLDRLTIARAPIAFQNALFRKFVDDPTTAPRDPHVPLTPRQMLQWWGTEYRRASDPDWWAKQAADKVDYHRRYGETRFVITDCRFANEAHEIRERSGTVWQIQRPGIDATTTAEGTHASATDGSEFKPDHFIHNSGTLIDLQEQVLAAFFAAEAGINFGQVSVNLNVLQATAENHEGSPA